MGHTKKVKGLKTLCENCKCERSGRCYCMRKGVKPPRGRYTK